jgi:AcrR family transcriptional regulator
MNHSAHAPQQERSRKTLERILDAAESLILERGAEAATIPEIVRAARSSVGSFYARFPDKRALLETLHERATRQSVERASLLLAPEAWATVPTAEVVRAFVALAVDLFGQRRSIMTAFATTFAGDRAFTERRAAAGEALAKRLYELLRERTRDLGHPDLRRASAMCLRVVTSVLEQRNLFLASGAARAAGSDAEVTRELTRVLLRYLDVAGHVERRSSHRAAG